MSLKLMLLKYFYFISLFLIVFQSCSEKQVKKKNNLKNPFLDKAEAYFDRGTFDTAYLHFNDARNLYLENKDSLGIGNCLIYMGVISTDNGDHFGAQEILLEALTYFNLNDTTNFSSIKSVYSTLGMASSNLKNYTKAIEFYKKALEYDIDNNSFFTIKNNIGNAYRENRDFEKAITIYKSILDTKNTNEIDYAKTLTNYTVAKWLQNSKYNAAPELLKALRIREKSHHSIEQNSSYSHLANYYGSSLPDSALYYARKMYEVNQRINSPDDRIEALKKLVRFGPPQEAKQYFKIYEQLDDSIQTARSVAKNQFAVIRYETEKHKADLLKAQAENLEKQKNILLKNIGIGILITSLILGYFGYRRRQKLMKQEKEIEVRNTEIKYVKKVHDHVANRIYQVIDEIDNNPQINKDEVAEKLDIIYNISRDLSYENIGSKYKHNFTKELSKMFASYQSPTVAIHVSGNEEKLWHNLSETVKSEVYAVLQELMTNMSKHSSASIVNLYFQNNSSHITIMYTDNGKGIKDFSPGNGLRNTETRIKSISGLITFDTKPDQGLKVKISLPI